MLSPYIPARYSIDSSANFLDLIKTAPTNGKIASLDVESLFTNVPVDRTIDFILNRVYHNENTPKLDIPEEALKTLLQICTKEAPFVCPRGKMYVQTDGVAMGSPLGVLFANFFMGTIEEKIFSESNKPSVYCRYVDDTFVVVANDQELDNLRIKFESKSGLRFTTEKSEEGSLPFLDVLLKLDNNRMNTSVFIKPTNTGHCLNGQSECPQRYLDTTIGAFVRRALSHCSDWRTTHKELERAHQVLVDNGYPNYLVSRVTKRILDGWYEGHPTDTNPGKSISIFYKSHMSTHYKTDERIIKDIIKRNVKPMDHKDKVSFVIYYKSMKTSSLLIKNNCQPKPSEMQSSHLVYKFTCNDGDCGPHNSYIGKTTTKLSRRLTCHLQQGAIKQHFANAHGSSMTREILEQGTKVMEEESDERRLSFLEALFIKQYSPSLNIQSEEHKILPTSKPMPRTLVNESTRRRPNHLD